jgi:hypothetical protein
MRLRFDWVGVVQRYVFNDDLTSMAIPNGCPAGTEEVADRQLLISISTIYRFSQDTEVLHIRRGQGSKCGMIQWRDGGES